jgi:hypothetical protein
MIRDTNPPEADQSESGVSEPKTTLFGEAIFQKIRGSFNHVFSEHDTESISNLKRCGHKQRGAPPHPTSTPIEKVGERGFPHSPSAFQSEYARIRSKHLKSLPR